MIKIIFFVEIAISLGLYINELIITNVFVDCKTILLCAKWLCINLLLNNLFFKYNKQELIVRLQYKNKNVKISTLVQVRYKIIIKWH